MRHPASPQEEPENDTFWGGGGSPSLFIRMASSPTCKRTMDVHHDWQMPFFEGEIAQSERDQPKSETGRRPFFSHSACSAAHHAMCDDVTPQQRKGNLMMRSTNRHKQANHSRSHKGACNLQKMPPFLVCLSSPLSPFLHVSPHFCHNARILIDAAN